MRLTTQEPNISTGLLTMHTCLAALLSSSLDSSSSPTTPSPQLFPPPRHPDPVTSPSPPCPQHPMVLARRCWETVGHRNVCLRHPSLPVKGTSNFRIYCNVQYSQPQDFCISFETSRLPCTNQLECKCDWPGECGGWGGPKGTGGVVFGWSVVGTAGAAGSGGRFSPSGLSSLVGTSSNSCSLMPLLLAPPCKMQLYYLL